MSKADFEEFIKRILREDAVSEYTLFGFIEKIITNIKIIEENKICLN
jgi:hypothetical protein